MKNHTTRSYLPRKSRSALVAMASMALANLASAPSADASCADVETEGGASLVDERVTTTALSPAGPHPVLGKSALASANTLHMRLTADLSEDPLLVGGLAVGATIENTPNPVQMDDGSFGIFIAQSNGLIRRVDPETGLSDWTASVIRTGGSACPSDSVTATPVVHLNRFASASFKAAYPGQDLVYVATRYGCPLSGGTTDNRIYALDAATGSDVWIFNESATVDMDVVLEAPFLNSSEDRLYVGTDRSASPTQHTLFSIDLITGTKAWSKNVGQVWTTPVVRGSRVYVATLAGDIRAYKKSMGKHVWTVSNGGVPIVTNPFVEFRDDYPDLIASVDFAGDITLVQDDLILDTGTWLWTTTLDDPDGGGTAAATSRVAIDSKTGKLYVGADDGQIYQLGLLSGLVEATREVDAGNTIGDASFVVESGNLNLIAGSSGGVLAKKCLPWSSEVVPMPVAVSGFAPGLSHVTTPPTGACADDSDCQSGSVAGPCSNFVCNVAAQVCVEKPVANGTSCDDENSFTFNDVCHSGACTGQSDCELELGRCKCTDETGASVDRVLKVAEPTSCPQPPAGFDLTDAWCGTGVSVSLPQNACIAHGTNAESVVWVELLDQFDRPFVIDENDPTNFVEMRLCNDTNDGCTLSEASPPTLLRADTGGPTSVLTTADKSLTASSIPGIYYSTVRAQGGSNDSIPWTLRTDVFMSTDGNTCIDTVENTGMTNIDIRLQMGQAPTGPTQLCTFDSDVDSSGLLVVQVNGNTGPVPNAVVRVGYADDKRFAKDFAEALSDTPSLPNTDTANGSGRVRFTDAGNYLNGPTRVFATCPGGTIGDANTKFADTDEDHLVQMELDC